MEIKYASEETREEKEEEGKKKKKHYFKAVLAPNEVKNLKLKSRISLSR